MKKILLILFIIYLISEFIIFILFFLYMKSAIKTLIIDYNDNIYKMVDIPLTFDKFKKMISEECKISVPYTIKYLDDDSNLVTISNDSNL